MKLKQINFNADLIGQDGIVVKTSKGKDVKQLTYFKCNSKFPVIGTVDDRLCSWSTDDTGLIMYKEVKVMTVDEFYDECYLRAEPYSSVLKFAHKLAAAIKAGEVE
jgi:hypothetical protein